MSEQGERVRLDVWLWAARFFRSRSLATEAVQGGRVHVNGARAKPSRPVAAGDRVELTVGETTWSVVVRAVAARRGPASEAAGLYVEMPESRERREREAGERRLARPPGADAGVRPTKRDRRRIEALRRGTRRQGR